MATAFTRYPKPYSSVFGDLVFTITGSELGSILDVEIFRYEDEIPFAVKRFIGGDAVAVNVAGYLKRYLSPAPCIAASMNLMQDPGRQIKIILFCGNSRSPSRVFTAAAYGLSNYQVLSIMPLQRSIWWNETDELSVVLPTSNNCSFTVALSGDRSFSYETSTAATLEGIQSLPVVMSDVASKIEANGFSRDMFDTMAVTLKERRLGEVTVSYDIRESRVGTVRLCWLNSLGGIEYHAFACVVAERRYVRKNRILGRDGVRSYAARVDNRTELTTGYMPAVWISALSEILSSPCVWRVDGKDYVPVDVLPGGFEIQTDKMNSFKFEIRDRIQVKIQKF